jgi:Bacterial Ig-like domain (group 3)
MSHLSPCRPTAGTTSRLGRRSARRRSIPWVILPVLAVISIPLAGVAQAAPAAATKLVITSTAFSAAASTSATNGVTIKLENAAGTAVSNATATKLFLSSSSAGRIFSGTSGGAAETSTTLPANTKSIKVFYGDADAGSPTITVSLSSPASNAGLTMATQTETVTAAPTTTTLTANPNPGTFGLVDTLTATVASGDGTPTGLVKFLDGTTTLCSAVSTTAGTATCGASSLQAATHPLTAVFSPSSGNFAASTSKKVSLVVAAASTATALTSAANPATFGAAVVLTAAVSSPAGSPAGTVTFSAGATTLCKKVTVNSGSATCSTSSLSLGVNALTASFASSSDDYANSSATPLSVTVNAAATSTSLTSSANPAAVGSSVTFTSLVSDAAGTAPGTITFSANSAPLCSAVTLKSGSATCTVTSLKLGSNSVTATYTSSSADFTGSASSPLVETIDPGVGAKLVITSAPFSAPATTVATTAVTVTLEDASGNPTTSASATKVFLSGSSAGRSFAATSGGAAETFTSLPANSSSVTFFYGDTNAGSPSITASLTSPASSAGVTEGIQTETITASPTTTTLTANPNPSTFGLLDTLTATVTSGDGAPAGSVTFLDGPTALCSAVATTGGVATCAVSSLQAATHSLSAVYTSSSANYTGSTSAVLTQAVNAAGTAIALTSSDGGTGTWPAAATVTATVTAASGAQPSGTVAFFNDGGPISQCAAVAFSPNAPAQCPLGTLDPGTYAITAAATPATANDTASTSATLTEVVQPAAATVTLTASPPTATAGQTITLTASVSAGTGTVTFSDGAVVLCANVPVSAGSASCPTTIVRSGIYALTATFTSASVGQASSVSDPFSETIDPGPGVALVITSAPFSTAAASSASSAITVTLEDANGNPTTSASAYRIFLGGTSVGKRFSATPGGTPIASVTLPANTQSVTVYYSDTSTGSPTITASLTSPPSNAGLLEGTQTESIS